MKTFFRGLTAKIILLILVPILLVSILFTLYLNYNIRKETISQYHGLMEKTMDEYALNLQEKLDQIASLAKKTAFFIETSKKLNEHQAFTFIDNNLLLNDYIYGSALLFNEAAPQTGGKNLFCYAHRKDTFYVHHTFSRGNTDYMFEFRNKNYVWQTPKETGKGSWSQPYVNHKAGEIQMITYSQPLFENGKFIGVTTVDVALSALDKYLSRKQKSGEYKKMSVLLLSSDHRLIFYNDPQFLGKKLEKVFSNKYFLAPYLRPVIDSILREKTSEKAHLFSISLPNPNLFYIRHFINIRWTLIIIYPEKTLYKMAHRFVIQNILVSISLMLIIIIVIIFSTYRLITEPLSRMSRTTQNIANGDYSFHVKINRKDEIGLLADNFRLMVSKLKKREEELREAHKKLEVAYQQLIALDEAKSEFLKLISHEIRTPLNGIVGSTYFLNDLIDDPELKEFTSMLKESVDRLERFSTNALFLTQLHTIGKDMEMTAVELGPIINQLKEEFSEQLREKQIKLEPGQISTIKVRGNETLIKKGLSEVLHNAIKFSTGNKITINTVETDDCVMVPITNRGPVIPEDKKEIILKAFGLAESHYDQNSGLGLAIVSSCQKLMGSRMQIESNTEATTISLGFLLADKT